MEFLRKTETQKVFCNVMTLTGFYAAIFMVHYYSSHAYVYYCTPSGWHGILVSPFVVSTPHCRALRWSIQNFSTTIENMWTILGTFVGTWIVTNCFFPLRS